MKKIHGLIRAFLCGGIGAAVYVLVLQQGPATSYIDPMIGADRTGNVVVGPCVPFGMARPGPDVAATGHNSGWGPLDEPLAGFSQTHVSGTGGSPRYGNVLLMPFTEGADSLRHHALRKSERAELGLYHAALDNGTSVTITSSAKAVLYSFTYVRNGLRGLEIDASWCRTGRKSSAQRVTSCEVRQLSPVSFAGHTAVEGGWGGGHPYRVYFHIETDHPAESVIELPGQTNILFDGKLSTVKARVGISYQSEEQARRNLESGIPGWELKDTRDAAVAAWKDIADRVRLPRYCPEKYKRMFYTALYHTMLMPSDCAGEWYPDSPEAPYYNDFYTLWDTYRTSMPLITLLSPERTADIIGGLLNIYRHDGYMPDGRSGNGNGATQGSSNAEIVIADAFVKGVSGIDCELALEAMIKDAEVAPADPRYEGRGGIEEYKGLGYVPWEVDRAGSRTVDHSFCDYAIHTVAKGLGHDDMAEKYLERSHNWQNLWRDFEEDGIRGFIMPRAADGSWIDSAMVSIKGRDTLIAITPSTSFQRWGGFFYEANTYETSLCVPHDMERLIALNGGRDGLKARLDSVFAKGCLDTGNEPSFLTPSLYHWCGRPDISSDICRKMVLRGYDDTPGGLPGNDDSGAMSSWMAWHMTGLYPVAGFDFYLIHSPLLRSVRFKVGNGKRFRITARGLSDSRTHIGSATLDGKPYPYSTISHEDIVRGGHLVLHMTSEPSDWGQEMFPPKDRD